jgi:hypothetical protein
MCNEIKSILSSRIKMGFVITFLVFYAALSTRNKITDLQNKKSHVSGLDHISSMFLTKLDLTFKAYYLSKEKINGCSSKLHVVLKLN